jgi:hypothetical protein
MLLIYRGILSGLVPDNIGLLGYSRRLKLDLSSPEVGSRAFPIGSVS